MRSMFIALCCALWVAGPLAAQGTPTQYRLERIVVEGSDAGEDAIRAEARLDEEKTYTDEDFRQAVYRVRRLPFVADATYRTEPGMTGGGTTLVIRVLQETIAFGRVDVLHVRPSEGDADTSAAATLGGRYLMNDLGVLEGGLTRTDESAVGTLLNLTYRAYDIYGTGAFAVVSLGKRFQTEDIDFDADMDVLGGWPLTQKQSLTLSAARRRFGIPRDFDVLGDDGDDPDGDDDEDDNITLTNSDAIDTAELRWWYESHDDPLFATRGLSLSFGPTWSHAEFDVETYDATLKEVVTTTEQFNGLGLVLDAAAYRRLVGRNVGFLRLLGNANRTDQVEDEDEAELPNLDRFSGQANVGLAHDFHSYDPNVLRRFRARVEASVGYGVVSVRQEDLPSSRFNQKNAEAAFIFRNRFGSIRLRATYLFD